MDWLDHQTLLVQWIVIWLVFGFALGLLAILMFWLDDRLSPSFSGSAIDPLDLMLLGFCLLLGPFAAIFVVIAATGLFFSNPYSD